MAVWDTSDPIVQCILTLYDTFKVQIPLTSFATLKCSALLQIRLNKGQIQDFIEGEAGAGAGAAVAALPLPASSHTLGWADCTAGAAVQDYFLSPLISYQFSLSALFTSVHSGMPNPLSSPPLPSHPIPPFPCPPLAAVASVSGRDGRGGSISACEVRLGQKQQLQQWMWSRPASGLTGNTSGYGQEGGTNPLLPLSWLSLAPCLASSLAGMGRIGSEVSPTPALGAAKDSGEERGQWWEGGGGGGGGREVLLSMDGKGWEFLPDSGT